MRASNRLTEIAVRAAKVRGRIADGNGLHLAVAEGGTKSWVFRYRFGPRRHDLGLGPLAVVSLAEARRRAQRIRQQLLDGIDPLGQRRADEAQARLDAAKAMTFDQCRDAYIAAHEPAWKNAKHRQQWRNTLETYATPVIGKLPVAAVDAGLLLQALGPIWSTLPETASRVRQRIERVLDWATVRGFRDGPNPAKWRGCLDHLLPATSKVRRVVHHAALPHREISAFMEALSQQDGSAAVALRLTILCATRTSETLAARWDEINFADALWIIPARRMKAAAEHRIPLCEPALDLLRQLHETRRGEFVFPGNKPGRPLSNMSMLMTLRRMGRSELTTHGFRATFKTWCSEETSHPTEVVEQALAHTLPSAVERAYRRTDLLDKRRRLMADWARYCTSPPATGVVVSMRAG